MKNKILSIVFVLFIGCFMIVNIIVPDKDLSISERRKLTKLPEITWENLTNGEIASKFEDYALDQFILRDEFRFIKVFTELNVLGKNDYNNLYYDKGYIFKIEYPLKENKVEQFSLKMNNLYDTYFRGMKVYYSIIPDKNYYNDDNYLKLDYDKVIDIVNSKMNNEMNYIDIRDSLSLEDYYNTDIHWRQEKLIKVVDKLSSVMDFSVGINYRKLSYEPFYGSYYGQLGLKVKADNLVYLSNEMIDKAEVKDVESSLDTIYEVESLGGIDSYDIFLGGATPLVEIINNSIDNGKELVIFRDSFGSSIAPLMLDGYKKITLVDLRYMSSSLLNNYIEFDSQDILLLYNTTIINNSDLIK